MSIVALDSNILAYFVNHRVGPGDGTKVEQVRNTINLLANRATIIAPVQALGELNVVLRRAGKSSAEARAQVEALAGGFETSPSLATTLSTALELSDRYQLQFWDSMIIAASLEAGCTLLLSEDMQDGFAVRGLTVVNPLLLAPHRALAKLLDG